MNLNRHYCKNATYPHSQESVAICVVKLSQRAV